MTIIGVREALAVLPTWRWAAAYVAAWIAFLALTTASRVSGALAGAVAGYLVAGPLTAAFGLLIGASTQDGPVFSLISSLVLDGATRLGRAMNRAAVGVADFAPEETTESYSGRRAAGARA